jgi:hypothetical protein
MRKQFRNAHQLNAFVRVIARRMDRGTILEDAGDYGVVNTDSVFPKPMIWVQVVIDAAKAAQCLTKIHSGLTHRNSLQTQLRALRIRHFNSLGLSCESVNLAASSRDHFTLSHFHEVFAGRRPKRTFQTESKQQANLRLFRLLPAKRVQDQFDAVGNS